MRIETYTRGDATVVEVTDRRIDARSAADLKQAISSLISSGAERLILDISEVELVDSSGLAAIIAASKLLGAKGELTIAGSQERVRQFFATTRMDQVLRLVPDLGSDPETVR